MKLSKITVAIVTLCLASVSYAAIPKINPTDAISKTVLAHELTGRLDSRAPTGTDASITIHREFPQIIEQNFAHYSPQDASMVIDGLTERELTDLAATYGRAVNDSGHKPMLLALLATRLDADHLARLAPYFGYAEVDEAIGRYAPSKEAGFSSAAIASLGAAPALTGIGQWLNYTPYEIYLDLRTAPVGALGVSGALFETANVLGLATGIAWGIGQTAGTAIGQLIQTYDPSLWTTIGGTIDQAVENLTTMWNNVTAAGKQEKSIGGTMKITPTVTTDSESYGGDYDSEDDWMVDYGDGCYVKTAPVRGSGGPTPDLINTGGC